MATPQLPAATRTAAAGASATPAATPGATPTSPDRYLLAEEVARGGMGVVYRATDTALGREVAVKVLQEKFGPDSAAARRFADEARITAQLQHPNVPAVHDLGVLPDGRPFLAMRLVKGQTLDQMLAARPDLSADRGRFVAAFEQACQAMAYAHAHGVVHRDLKPENVMVGAFGEVQVMDWGLAKVLSGEAPPEGDPLATTAPTEVRPLRGGEAFTQAGSVLGTPAFMPPEQAAGAVAQIDARSDVFGLGAVLAVVLTGRPPFEAGSAEAARVRASQGDVADCFARLDGCGADPGLVALCKRCLTPRPADRPADAGEVAAAVAGLRAAADERARRAELDKVRMEGETAAAALRLAEGRRRRRLWLALALALACGLAAAVTLALQANEARKAAVAAEQVADERRVEAEAAQRRAEGETRLAKAVKDFLQHDVLQLADPAIQQRDGKLAYDADVRLRDVVLRASRAIEGRFSDRPLVEAELRWTLGWTLQGMGRPDLAAGHYERMRAIYAEHLGPGHPDTLASMNNLASSYAELGRHPEALRLVEKAMALRKEKLGLGHPDTLQSMHNLASMYDKLGRHPEALRLGEQVLALRRESLGAHHPDTLGSMNTLANSYHALGRHPEALKLREQVLALRRERLGPSHPDTLGCMHNLANSYAELGRLAEALGLREQVLAVRREKLGPGHPDTIMSMSNLANSYEALGRHVEALGLREQVLALRKEKLGPGHPDTLTSMHHLAVSYAELGRHPEALRLNEQTLALRKEKLGPDYPDTLNSALGVVRSLVALERPEGALLLLDETLALAERAAAAGKPPHHRLRPALIDLRLRICRDRKDAGGLRRSAELYEGLGLWDAGGLYDAACWRAVLAGLLSGGAAKAEADRAMAWLCKAVAAGYKDRAHMEKDADLDPLRRREDFRKLLAGLPAKSADGGAKAELLPVPRRE